MQTTLHSCPSCSTVITFHSRDTNCIVCHQCGSRLQRWDDGVLKEKGEMVSVQDTLSPIRIGTTGVWNNKKFTVIGRVRCYFEESVVNNWNIYFEDGRLLALVESYGQFAIYEKVPSDVKLTYSKVYRLAMGNGVVESASGQNYILERKNTCLRIEVEGEVWVFDWNGVFGTVEAASLEGDRVEIMDLENNSYLYFRIHYEDFDAFNFQQLRSLKVGNITKTLPCNQCNKSNELKSFPLAQSFVCKHCGAALSYHEGRVKYRQKLKLDKTPAIPLYSKGVLKGTEYEVVGYAEKEDAHGWPWREYTLFSPMKGYAFLSEYNGHWIFLLERTKLLSCHTAINRNYCLKESHSSCITNITIPLKMHVVSFPATYSMMRALIAGNLFPS
ncbi:DUF4178 domain-containing protein [Paraflavitalea speifideaquila]|uniref:DUF4178 domain-containing protein n=1 Tax=Paraflavitalea speifideaquila TaxID=3076558 RepID=UPI0028E8C70A|nr:DUF4178 domain-containing protein [Paraflavitalea speifideiaquila]